MSDIRNSDTVSVLLEKSVVLPLGVTDLDVKINDDNVSPLTDEKARISSLEEPKAKEYDSKVLASMFACPSTKFTNGAEHIEDFETPACSENQVLLFSCIQVSSNNYGL